MKILTFTFTIDCFPAYTKFDKTHKVMAELITLDAEGDSHPYDNEAIMGHKGRTKDADVDEYYAKSVFNAGE